MPTPRVAELLGEIADALKPLKRRWYVFGAQAVIAAGAVRGTADIDITVDDLPVETLRAAFQKAGFVLRGDIKGLDSLMEHHRILPLLHRKTGFQVDVVRAGPGLEEQMLRRAIFRKLGARRIPFVETNDLVVLKILASRSKDIEDVKALLLAAAHEIDPTVIRQRLALLGTLIDDSSLLTAFEDLQSSIGGSARRDKPKRSRSFNPRRRAAEKKRT